MTALGEAVGRYLKVRAAGVSRTTMRTDRSHLEQFVEWQGAEVDVAAIALDDVAEYVTEQRERGLSPHTIQRQHAALSALWTWFTTPEIGLADVNVVKAVPTPDLPKRLVETLTRGQFAELLRAAGETGNPLRDRAILVFLLDTAARASELCGVMVGDVDFDTGRCRVIGKRDKQRQVYVQVRSLMALQLYLDKERPQNFAPNLFLTKKGRAMTRYTLTGILTRLEERTGIHCNPHLFRHTSAIEHLRGGMSVVELQKMLGHEDLDTTRKYLTALKDEDVEVQAMRSSPVEHWVGGGPGLIGKTPEADAVTWCAEHSAAVTFSRVNGSGRVTVCVGGFLTEEGESLAKAVDGARRKIERFMEAR